jgi:hypothetical protein
MKNKADVMVLCCWKLQLGLAARCHCFQLSLSIATCIVILQSAATCCQSLYLLLYLLISSGQPSSHSCAFLMAVFISGGAILLYGDC